jgi:MFS family permease
MATGLFVQIGLIAHLFNLLAPAMGAQARPRDGPRDRMRDRRAHRRGPALPAGRDRRLAAGAAYAVQLAGVLLLAVATEQQLGWIVVGIVLFGSGIGNATSLPPLIAQVEFTKEDVPRVVALIVGIAQATYAFAPAVFGVLLAISGGNDVHFGRGTVAFFVVAAILQAAAIACFLAGRKRGQQHP